MLPAFFRPLYAMLEFSFLCFELQSVLLSMLITGYGSSRTY